MTAPDIVEKGSMDTIGRESLRFKKKLSNGYVVIVGKEQKQPICYGNHNHVG